MGYSDVIWILITLITQWNLKTELSDNAVTAATVWVWWQRWSRLFFLISADRRTFNLPCFMSGEERVCADRRFRCVFFITEWFTWFIEDLCRCSAVGNSLLCFRFRIQSRASSSSTGGERTWRRSLNQLLFVTEVWPLTSACFCLVHKEGVTFCPPLCKTTDYFNDHFLD